MSRHGDHVQSFERAFAEYVGARYAIALCNGTATLHTALEALSDPRAWENEVAVPPLTMASTTIAVLHLRRGVPVFVDVDPDTWLMQSDPVGHAAMPVSLYGLHYPPRLIGVVDDAAQTLRPHGPASAFTSYSFQASKILPLGEGGMLVTDDEGLARRAREFSSLGYRMDPDGPVIEKGPLKDPGHARHHALGWNYRMAGAVAERGWEDMLTDVRLPKEWETRPLPDVLLRERREAAALYRDAVTGCDWITPQHVPDGWTHDYWSFAVALESADLWHPFADAVERRVGERPYAAWRLTYQEPAFRHLAEDGTCPVAEDLQPRLVQMQTNSLGAAKRNADAVHEAIREMSG